MRHGQDIVRLFTKDKTVITFLLLTMLRDQDLIRRLIDGDSTAYDVLVSRYNNPLMGLARNLIGNRAVAEEVVQDTWIAVMQGIHKFEGRSSLKTWIFRILTYQARKRATREARTIAWSDLFKEDDASPTVDPSRFKNTGAWHSPPAEWVQTPEDKTIEDDMIRLITEGLDLLPQGQQAVLRLRDIEGWSAREVCDVLNITTGNQRVLLHRARAKVRAHVASYFEHAQEASP